MEQKNVEEAESIACKTSSIGQVKKQIVGKLR